MLIIAMTTVVKSTNQPMSKLVSIKNPWVYCCSAVTRPRRTSGTRSWITEPEVVRKVPCPKDIIPISSIAATTQLACAKRMTETELTATAPRQTNPLLN